MSDPRGHHFVPQAYLRGFASHVGKRWQADVIVRATGERTRRNVRDIFKRRDWHTIVDAEGVPDFSIEKFFAEHIEDPSAPILERLRRTTFPLDYERKTQFAMFMSAQLVRGRHWRSSVSEFIEETNRHLMKLTAVHYDDDRLREITGAEDVVSLRDTLMHNEDRLIVRPTNAMLLDTTLSSVAEIGQLLAMRTWTLVRFEEPTLLTGESPVVHITAEDDSTGYGVVTAEQLYMAISPCHGLL